MHDIPSAVPVFHSGGDTGMTEPAQAARSRGVRARKRVGTVQVCFVARAYAVETLEGVVQAKPGDAIVSGSFGEVWPVARDSFTGKYEALPPLEMGAPGAYLSLPIEVLATPMHAPFEVVLADGHSRLHGQAGDWLVDYGDGNLGVVNGAIFAATYEVLEAS